MLIKVKVSQMPLICQVSTGRLVIHDSFYQKYHLDCLPMQSPVALNFLTQALNLCLVSHTFSGCDSISIPNLLPKLFIHYANAHWHFGFGQKGHFKHTFVLLLSNFFFPFVLFL